MKKIIFPTLGILSLFFLFLTFSGFSLQDDKHPEVDFTISCEDCHKEETPEVTKAWFDGIHGTHKVGCFVCHGDGEERFFPKPDSESCIACHSDQEVDWEESKHKSCFDCHDGHTLKFH